MGRGWVIQRPQNTHIDAGTKRDTGCAPVNRVHSQRATLHSGPGDNDDAPSLPA